MLCFGWHPAESWYEITKNGIQTGGTKVHIENTTSRNNRLFSTFESGETLLFLGVVFSMQTFVPLVWIPFLVISYQDSIYQHWKTRKLNAPWLISCHWFIPIPPKTSKNLQNGQTHSNNLWAIADELFDCVWPFCKFSDVYRRYRKRPETWNGLKSSNSSEVSWIRYPNTRPLLSYTTMFA